MGEARVDTQAEKRRLLSGDFYSQGEICAAVIRPPDAQTLAEAAALTTRAGYALIPRGGGMSYTGGYTPQTQASIMVDVSDLDEIRDFDPDNMVITVGAGATWETIHATLKPYNLRLPFFGTFSGRKATVGGGLSNGAVFFGSARYGTAADQVLGLEVVTAKGRLIRTGQAAFRNGKPFYRTYGPDFTGLFLHDCGALGVKTEACFRLIETPRSTGCLSFAFPDALSAADALSQVARSGLAEEAYAFDPQTTQRSLQGNVTASDLRRLGRILAGKGGLRAGARLVATGKRAIPPDVYSLHLVCAGRSEAEVSADLARCRKECLALGARELPNSVPLAIRADPFDNLNGVLGPKGERWVALNAKVTHKDAPALIAAFSRLLAKHQTRLDELGIEVSTLFMAIQAQAFSFEPVFHWPDRWLPMHRAIPDSRHLQQLSEPEPNEPASALVAQLRLETLDLFSELGAASNQIGRTYPYLQNLQPETAELLRALKAHLDPDDLMNPGVLQSQPLQGGHHTTQNPHDDS